MAAPTMVQLAGARPSPRKYAFDTWGFAGRDGYLDYYNGLAYNVTFYVSLGGSDSNDGLSTGAPKLNGSAARTALQSYLITNPTHKGRILFRRGDRFDSAADDVDFSFGVTQCVCIDAYGAGLRPVRSGFHRKVTSGWTLANLDRYTITQATAVGWIREQARRLTRAYKKVASAGAVESTPYSWFYTGTTLHINAGAGVNPNSVPFEIATTYGASGGHRGVALYAADCRASNMVFEGWGIGDGTGAYPVTILPSPGETILVENVAAYYGPNHCVGQLTGNTSGGGTAVLVNVETGYCCTNGSTNVISFNNTGGQKMYIFGHSATYGQAPDAAWVTSLITRLGQSSYCHTGGGGTVIGELLAWDEKVKTANQWGCTVGFAVSPDVAAAATPSLCTVVYTDTKIDYADGAQCPPPGQGVCFRRGDYLLKPYDSIFGNGFATLAGFALKIVRACDMTLQTSTVVDWQTPNGGSSAVTFEGCHQSYKILNNATTNILTNFENALGAQGNKLISSIVSLDQRGLAGLVGLMANNSAAGINHSALYGWDAVSAWGAPFGTGNGSAAVSLYDVPVVGFRPTETSQLFGAGVNADEDDRIDYDHDGRLIATSATPDIGPYSATAASVSSVDVAAIAAATYALIHPELPAVDGDGLVGTNNPAIQYTVVQEVAV